MPRAYEDIYWEQDHPNPENLVQQLLHLPSEFIYLFDNRKHSGPHTALIKLVWLIIATIAWLIWWVPQTIASLLWKSPTFIWWVIPVVTFRYLLRGPRQVLWVLLVLCFCTVGVCRQCRGEEEEEDEQAGLVLLVLCMFAECMKWPYVLWLLTMVPAALRWYWSSGPEIIPWRIFRPVDLVIEHPMPPVPAGNEEEEPENPAPEDPTPEDPAPEPAQEFTLARYFEEFENDPPAMVRRFIEWKKKHGIKGNSKKKRDTQGDPEKKHGDGTNRNGSSGGEGSGTGSAGDGSSDTDKESQKKIDRDKGAAKDNTDDSDDKVSGSGSDDDSDGDNDTDRAAIRTIRVNTDGLREYPDKNGRTKVKYYFSQGTQTDPKAEERERLQKEADYKKRAAEVTRLEKNYTLLKEQEEMRERQRQRKLEAKDNKIKRLQDKLRLMEEKLAEKAGLTKESLKRFLQGLESEPSQSPPPRPGPIVVIRDDSEDEEEATGEVTVQQTGVDDDDIYDATPPPEPNSFVKGGKEDEGIFGPGPHIPPGSKDVTEFPELPPSRNGEFEDFEMGGGEPSVSDRRPQYSPISIPSEVSDESEDDGEDGRGNGAIGLSGDEVTVSDTRPQQVKTPSETSEKSDDASPIPTPCPSRSGRLERELSGICDRILEGRTDEPAISPSDGEQENPFDKSSDGSSDDSSLPPGRFEMSPPPSVAPPLLDRRRSNADGLRVRSASLPPRSLEITLPSTHTSLSPGDSLDGPRSRSMPSVDQHRPDLGADIPNPLTRPDVIPPPNSPRPVTPQPSTIPLPPSDIETDSAPEPSPLLASTSAQSHVEPAAVSNTDTNVETRNEDSPDTLLPYVPEFCLLTPGPLAGTNSPLQGALPGSSPPDELPDDLMEFSAETSPIKESPFDEAPVDEAPVEEAPDELPSEAPDELPEAPDELPSEAPDELPEAPDELPSEAPDELPPSEGLDELQGAPAPAPAPSPRTHPVDRGMEWVPEQETVEMDVESASWEQQNPRRTSHDAVMTNPANTTEDVAMEGVDTSRSSDANMGGTVSSWATDAEQQQYEEDMQLAEDMEAAFMELDEPQPPAPEPHQTFAIPAVPRSVIGPHPLASRFPLAPFVPPTPTAPAAGSAPNTAGSDGSSVFNYQTINTSSGFDKRALWQHLNTPDRTPINLQPPAGPSVDVNFSNEAPATFEGRRTLQPRGHTAAQTGEATPTSTPVTEAPPPVAEPEPAVVEPPTAPEPETVVPEPTTATESAPVVTEGPPAPEPTSEPVTPAAPETPGGPAPPETPVSRKRRLSDGSSSPELPPRQRSFQPGTPGDEPVQGPTSGHIPPPSNGGMMFSGTNPIFYPPTNPHPNVPQPSRDPAPFYTVDGLMLPRGHPVDNRQQNPPQETEAERKKRIFEEKKAKELKAIEARLRRRQNEKPSIFHTPKKGQRGTPGSKTRNQSLAASERELLSPARLEQLVAEERRKKEEEQKKNPKGKGKQGEEPEDMDEKE